MLHFASENYDKTHPKVLMALTKSNAGFVESYGNDGFTAAVTKKFIAIFGSQEIKVFFCFNGTGANNFAIGSIAEKHRAVLCSDISHLYTAESTAPEAFTGCRLYPIKSKHGKIVIADLLQRINTKNGVHLPEASVLSITQPTEYGTVYNRDELRVIKQICKDNLILLHVDGARIFNALVAMDCTLADFVAISGVDVITIGGTKAGLMFGEAVVFLDCKRFKNLEYNHKRSMQLASKNRFIAVQFAALFENDLWKKIAEQTNSMAKYLEQELAKIDGRKTVYPVETNMVFIKMNNSQFNRLKALADFYRWNVHRNEVRIALSPGNNIRDIKAFLKYYSSTVSGK